MTPLSLRGLDAALAAARAHGLPADGPVVLSDRANLVVHLAPAPVVARVPTLVAVHRPHVAGVLRRALDLTAHLADQGAAVAPLPDVERGPFEHDGLHVVFERYVEHDPDAVIDRNELAASLDELHSALATYPGELPFLAPLFEHAAAIVGAIRGVVGDDGVELLRAALDWTRTELRPGPDDQPLHGDAHARNVFMTAHGLVWNDFEDTCRGPLAWDLACMTQLDHDVPPELAPYRRARELQGVIWRALIGSQRPERAEEARQRFRAWSASNR